MILKIFFIDFIYGFISSILCIFEIRNIIKYNIFIKYLKLIFFNIILLIIPNILFNTLYNNHLISNYIILNYIINTIKFLWNIPVYICCYVISMDKLGDLLNYLDDDNKIKKESVEKNIYFMLLSSVFYLSISILNYISNNFIFLKILSFLFISNSYGYFCFEYTCSYKNIENIEKITIIEEKPFIFIGFGTLYTIFYIYLNFINFFLFFIIVFPLSVNKLMKMNIYTIKEKNLYNSTIFVFPIYILNIILSIIDSYVISTYNVKLQN